MTDTDKLQSGVTWDSGLDTVTESQYADVIKTVYPEAMGERAQQMHVNLQSRHFLYWESTENLPRTHNGQLTSYGDCGSPRVNAGSAGLTTVGEIGKGTKFASLGASVFSKVNLVAGLGGVLSTIGVVTFGIGLVLAPLAFILGNHAKAVALEQNDLCGAFRYINPLLDEIDNAFYSGQISEADAVRGLQNLHEGAQRIISPVEKKNQSQCNAGCVLMYFLEGNIMLRTKYLYPEHTAGLLAKILPSSVTQLTSEIGKVTSDTLNTFSGGSINVSTNTGLLIFLFALIVGIGFLKMGKQAHATA